MSPPKIALLFTHDWDECDFFIDYLDRKNIIRKNRFANFDGPADICHYLTDSLQKHFRDTPEKINGVVSDMLYALNEKIPSEEEVAWLKNDKRACFWLWTELNNIILDVLPLEKVKEIIPHSHQERLREVLKKHKVFHLKDEHQRWGELVSQWSEIKEDGSLVGYLSPDDEDIVSYAWKYLCSHGHDIAQKYAPLDNEERYFSILNYMDFYLTNPLKKELLLRKIKPAIHQYSYRVKKQDTSVSKKFYLKNENAGKLKALLNKNRMTLDEYFNALIEQESDKLT
ncbi:Uncharacterised protein [Serratia marcescens]|uniref:hypothetical protein n=1 Tax=Serratia TaxID=613 RepID=UPI0007451D2F|nr:hypothetical protein [Serratia marcescens]MBI6167301.1 hypothetical protein [Serratia marcescens]MCF1215358.1 hypothetical protein [Serratia marcescens]MCF1317882.1 hypothetical protein [Serratia marcescens]MCF1322636.1 hypothetical protein [Serratia marcescens]MDV5424519.1 hypothetical protein [Serratia marcescens]